MSEYRFKHFTTRIIVNDMRFSNAALKVGDSLPNIDLPTLLVVKGGEKVDQVFGARPKAELKRVLEKVTA